MSTNPLRILASIADVCDDANATVAFHVRSLDGNLEIGSGADARSVTASTYKVPVMLEVAAQASEGRIQLADRIKVPADRRTIGLRDFSDDGRRGSIHPGLGPAHDAGQRQHRH